MTKRTTTIKGRGVTITVDDGELDKAAAERTAQQATAAKQSQMFDLLDAVSNAKSDLEGTARVMSVIINGGEECDDGVAATIERWLQADMDAFNLAFAAAWDGIVRPEHEREG